MSIETALAITAIYRKCEYFMDTSYSNGTDYRYNWPMDVSNQAVTETTPHAGADQESPLCALLARITAKDDTALGQFYDMTAARVYGLAIKLCGDCMLAEEVTSDVYTQVWQQAERYSRDRGKVSTWILTLCRSRAIDALRRADKALSHSSPNTLLDSEASIESEPLNLLQTVERDSAVYMALKQLDNDQQQLLSLAFFRDLSHQQIADFTGLPLGTVKTQLRTAQRQLKDLLKGPLGRTSRLAEEDL